MENITHNLLWMIYGAAAVVCVYVVVALVVGEQSNLILGVSAAVWVILVSIRILAHPKLGQSE